MKKLTREEVLRIADLAKLQLSSEEVDKLGNQLSEILNYVGKLNEVDTKNVEPANQITGLTNFFRKDETSDERMFTPNEATSNAPTKKGNLFKVPRLLNQ